MIITYKAASADDAELLKELYDRSFYADFLRYGECPAYNRTVAQMRTSIERYPKLIILADEKPVGVISAQDNSGRIYLGCLCVVPEYQGRGIGSAAIKKLEELYPERKSIELITPADKVENVGFYSVKCGFTVSGEKMDGNVRVVRLVKNYKIGGLCMSDRIEYLVGRLGFVNSEACAAAEELADISAESDEVYGYMDAFIAMLNSDNSYIRMKAIWLIAANSRWDRLDKITSCAERLLCHITDEKPIAARQFIKNMPEIARNKPKLKDKIVSALNNADTSGYKDSMKPLIDRDIKEALDKIVLGGN